MNTLLTIKDFIKRHPVLTYFLLAFAISWGGLLAIFDPAPFFGTREISVVESSPFVYLASLGGLQVKDLPARIADLKNQGVRFRNEMEVGPGGKQIQVEDPDGNPIELFEPIRQ
jgi:hypothetical protein